MTEETSIAIYRVCVKCGETQKHAANGLCRPCYNSQDKQKSKRAEYRRKNRGRLSREAKIRYAKNAEVNREKSASFRREHPDYLFENSLKRNYNLTVDEYKALLDGQKNRCAICKSEPVGEKRLFVDHNHETGITRALLCVNCNFLIGHAKERPELLEEAATYLRLHAA